MAALPESRFPTKLFNFSPLLQHSRRKRLDDAWLILEVLFDVAVHHCLDLMVYLCPVPDWTLLGIAWDFVVGPAYARPTIRNHIIGQNAVAQLLPGIGKQGIVDGELPTVLHVLD